MVLAQYQHACIFVQIVLRLLGKKFSASGQRSKIPKLPENSWRILSLKHMKTWMNLDENYFIFS